MPCEKPHGALLRNRLHTGTNDPGLLRLLERPIEHIDLSPAEQARLDRAPIVKVLEQAAAIVSVPRHLPDGIPSVKSELNRIALLREQVFGNFFVLHTDGF